MLKASTPFGETERLKSLKSLAILDTPPEERFDRITRLVAHFFQMPIAAVSLIDSDRVWLKSRVGTRFVNIPRKNSFCGHVIATGKMILVSDVLEDERFADNPYVRNAPHIRSYFGVPLMSPGGHPIGALCMVDRKPRHLSVADTKAFISLAVIAGNELAAIDLNHAVAEQSRRDKWVRMLLNHLPNGVILLDECRVVDSYNPAAEQLFGASLSGLVGADAGSLTIDDLSWFLSMGIGDDGIHTLETTGRRTDGSPFPMEVSVTPTHLGGKKKYAVMVRDMTAKKVEEARRQVGEERRQKYYSSAAHELRSPLGSLSGFANMLAKRQLPEEAVREIAGIMSTETGRLVKLINEMLDFAHLENGGTDDFDIRLQSLAPVIETTLQSLGGIEGINRVVCTFEPGMPDAAIDARKMQQALTNILGNAIKFSPNGGKIDLIVRTAMAGNTRIAQIVVRDRGIGMTPAQKERIFEPFYRARQLASAEGNGLGMAITKDLIKLQRGSISVDSILGEGAEITICLPLQ